MFKIQKINKRHWAPCNSCKKKPEGIRLVEFGFRKTYWCAKCGRDALSQRIADLAELMDELEHPPV